MFHFDNIMFSAKEAVVVGPVVGPTALAAAPTLPSADVVSFINILMLEYRIGIQTGHKLVHKLLKQ